MGWPIHFSTLSSERASILFSQTLQQKWWMTKTWPTDVPNNLTQNLYLLSHWSKKNLRDIEERTYLSCERFDLALLGRSEIEKNGSKMEGAKSLASTEISPFLATRTALWAGFRRSTAGYLIMLNNCPISWSSKRQVTDSYTHMRSWADRYRHLESRPSRRRTWEYEDSGWR